MDETSIFYQVLANFTDDFFSGGNMNRTMKSEKRITAMFCCDMTGTNFISVTMIDLTQNPNMKEMMVFYGENIKDAEQVQKKEVIGFCVSPPSF
jgi:hypothetical protein